MGSEMCIRDSFTLAPPSQKLANVSSMKLATGPCRRLGKFAAGFHGDRALKNNHGFQAPAFRFGPRHRIAAQLVMRGAAIPTLRSRPEHGGASTVGGTDKSRRFQSHVERVPDITQARLQGKKVVIGDGYLVTSSSPSGQTIWR